MTAHRASYGASGLLRGVGRDKRPSLRRFFTALISSLLCGAACYGPPTASAERPPSVDALVAAFEQHYAATPRLAALAALKRDFPADYRRALVRAKARLPREAPRSAAHAAGLVFLDEFIMSAGEVVARDAGEMKHAELPLLDRYEATLLDVLRGLQATSPRNCIDYATDNAIGVGKATSADELTIGNNIAARLDALANGKARKITRPEPSEQAFDAFAKAAEAVGLSPEALERLKKGKNVPDDQAAAQCESFIVAHEALADLPPETRTNLLANQFIPVYYGRRR